jgi:uncharacterized protein (DUF433 family)
MIQSAYNDDRGKLRIFQWRDRFCMSGKKIVSMAWCDAEFPVKSKNFDISFSSVLNKAKQLSLFVDMNPDILGGTPRVAGTRIPVYMVLNAVGEHGSIEGATCSYRSLSTEQIRDAIHFAANVLESPIEHEAETAGR